MHTGGHAWLWKSDGLLEGEYLQSEQDDALEIIDWLVKQPWCGGNVGMVGISWGALTGYSGLPSTRCAQSRRDAVLD